MKKYLGYLLVSPGYNVPTAGHYDFAVCKGDSPAAVVEDYFEKLGYPEFFDKDNVRVNSDGSFIYRDNESDADKCRCNRYFIELPDGADPAPEMLGIVHGPMSSRPIHNIGDSLWFNLSSPSAEILRTIVAITIFRNGVVYHFNDGTFATDEELVSADKE